MFAPQTHLGIDAGLCGSPVRLTDGHAEVRLATVPAMAVDESGLVHGGFVFGLADHAAMLAVNDPNVVLGGANTRFLKPVRVGEVVVAVATVGAWRRRDYGPRAIRLGKNWRYPAAELAAWIDTRPDRAG